MEKPLLIFDFDGTICDSEQSLTQCLIESSRILKFKTPNQEDIQNMKKMSTHEALVFLGISFWKIPLTVILIRLKMKKHLKNLEFFKKIPDTLKKLSSSSTICILSTNSRSNIEFLLQRAKIFDITHIEGSVGLFSKTKKLKKVIQDLNYQNNLSSVFYIGDETRDIEAAKNANIKSVAVSWGNNHIDLLKKYNPDISVYNVEELNILVS